MRIGKNLRYGYSELLAVLLFLIVVSPFIWRAIYVPCLPCPKQEIVYVRDMGEIPTVFYIGNKKYNCGHSDDMSFSCVATWEQTK